MSDFSRLLTNPPPEQEAIRAKCFHPGGVLPDFPKDEVESSIPERFETIVRRHPDRPAVKVGNQVLTYALINDMANRIARSILRRRSEQSEPIALMFRKGAEQIAAMLGVLKAGKILVVVDPLFPEKRIRTMICDSQAPWLVCDAQSIGLAQCVAGSACDVVEFAMLDQDITGVDLPLQMSPTAFACLIYSSGSTGQPKGIIQNHRNILHTTWIRVHDSNACYNDRVADLTSGTANSIFDMLLALLSGATLLPFDVRTEGANQLASWMVEEGVSLCWISSRLFRTFCQSLTGTEWFPSLRFLRLRSEAGQREDIELFKNHFSRHCIFGNGLSSSETGYLALYAIDHECTGVGEDLPVGYPVLDKEIRLLDDCGNDVGRNVVGEIVVRSRYLSPGYWRRPELTEAKFKPDPRDPAKRLYYTGDLGMMLPDGCLIHKGRKDFRVKIRGYGVDLIEVEKVLLRHHGVREAVVVASKSKSDETRLIGYFTSSTQQVPSVNELRGFLQKTLADYMIPSVFVNIDKIPLTSNGKVDRKVLPAADNLRPELDTQFVEPRTMIERELVSIWAEILSLQEVGIHDSFFDLGGHSLAAMRVVSQVIQKFQLELPFQSLFQTPTVAEMATVIMEHQGKRLGEEELERMLGELESLSDEEAQRILAEETTSTSGGARHE